MKQRKTSRILAIIFLGVGLGLMVDSYVWKDFSLFVGGFSFVMLSYYYLFGWYNVD